MSLQVNITGGLVSVEDGIPAKTGDFDPKRKVKVELSFTVAEGSDAQPILDYVSKMAHAQVNALLGKAKPETAAAPAPAVEGGKPETAAARKKRETAEAAALAAATPGKTKADLAKEAGLPVTSTQHKGTTAALVEEDELEGDPAPAPVAEEDALADLLGDTAPVPVTDQELGKAAQEKNGDMKGKPGWAPEKIRELVGKFVLVDGKPKAGAKLQEIPAAQRHDFLAQLKALK